LRHGHRPPTGTSTQLAIHTRPVTCDFSLHTAHCTAGISTTWRMYPGDHLLTDNQAVGDVVNWFGDRFTGRPAQNDC
ncbi:hypothetical protein ABZ758_49895, partial [Streptomyces sp. NPDC006668]